MRHQENEPALISVNFSFYDEERLDPQGIGFFCLFVCFCLFLFFVFLFVFVFNLKREQEIAFESMLMNRDLLVVLPTGHGKPVKFHKHT